METLPIPKPNTFQPGTAGIAKTEVELSISGRNLRDMDTFSKSDPLCVVYLRNTNHAGEKWSEIARTECIDNNLNPDFATKVNIEYLFEEQQFLKFDVYDMDSDSRDLKHHDFIGSSECTLGQIISARGRVTTNGVVLRLRNENDVKINCGELLIKSEDMAECKDTVELTFGANITIKDQSPLLSVSTSLILIASCAAFFSLYIGVILLVIRFLVWLLSKSSRVFLTISRANESLNVDQNMNVVYRTELNYHQPATLTKPAWKTIHLPIKTLCNGDLKRPIKIECHQFRRSGNHLSLGEVLTTTQMLLQNTDQKFEKQIYTILKPSSSCELEVINCQINKIYSFLDYIQGGTELACTVSIDFTASNGDPFHPESLHYINSSGNILFQNYG